MVATVRRPRVAGRAFQAMSPAAQTIIATSGQGDVGSHCVGWSGRSVRKLATPSPRARKWAGRNADGGGSPSAAAREVAAQTRKTDASRKVEGGVKSLMKRLRTRKSEDAVVPALIEQQVSAICGDVRRAIEQDGIAPDRPARAVEALTRAIPPRPPRRRSRRTRGAFRPARYP